LRPAWATVFFKKRKRGKEGKKEGRKKGRRKTNLSY
jgi:hypothetical protein